MIKQGFAIRLSRRALEPGETRRDGLRAYFALRQIGRVMADGFA
jgi:hypothetical protein